MMGAFGSGTGLVFASYNLVMVEVLGLAMLQPTLSITGLFNGALFLIIGPFIGTHASQTSLLSIAKPPPIPSMVILY